MCYKCHFCGDISKPGQPLLKHITYKEVPSKPKVRRIVIGQDSRGKDQTRYVEDGTCRVGKDILSEVPVCKECYNSLSLGITTEQLRRNLLLRGKAPEQHPTILRMVQNAEVRGIPLDPVAPEAIW